MTNAISGSTTTLPSTATTPAAGAQPDALPLVAGGGSQVAGSQPMTASAPQSSLVDQAMADVLGTSVVGGGADAPSSDPAAGIPQFVRQYLSSDTGPAVPAPVEGAAQLQAPQTVPGQVQQGWAWIGCAPSAPQAPPVVAPPVSGPSVEQAPPEKGDAPPFKGMPPTKGDVPTAPTTPPGKGTPPSKGTPPGKGTPPPPVDGPDKVREGYRRQPHTVRAGETLSEIAPKYGITWQELFRANKGRIDDPNLIYPGQRLRIPVPSDESPRKDPTKRPERPADRTPDGPPPTTPPRMPLRPPGVPSTDGTLPPTPPVPDTGTMPPTLPPG